MNKADIKAFPQIEGRLEDRRLLTGHGRYIDDLPVSKRTAEAAFLRSPHAHARIEKIDISAALAIKGVYAIYSASDLSEVLDPFPNIIREAPAYRGIASDRVRYVGEPILIAVARDRYLAEDALSACSVTYDLLPVVIDIEDAVSDTAPALHEGLKNNTAWRSDYRYGDPEAAWKRAERIVSVQLHFPKYNSTPLETYGVVAAYHEETKSFDIDANFQGPFSLLPVLARALRTSDSRINLSVPQDIGGSFGNKAMIYPYMGLIAAAARLCGRPVKWIEDRSEHLLASASGTDRLSNISAAITNDGRIHAIKLEILENVGAYLRAPEPSCVMRSLTTFSGPYHIENGTIDARCILTNKLPTGLNRGYGGQQYIFSLERLMDAVARELNMDPVEIRRRNFLKKDQFPHETTTGSIYDSGDYEGCLDKALQHVHTSQWIQKRDHLRAQGKLAGIGLATAIHSAASNIGYVTLALAPDERQKPNYNHKSGTNDAAQISLDPSGRIRVQIATAGSGQGHATTAAQIAADLLGVNISDIDVIDSINTSTTPWTITTGSYASRFAVIVGAAVARAATRLKEQLLKISADILAVSPEQLVMREGAVVLIESNRSLSLRQIAGALQWNRGDLTTENAQLQISETYSARNLSSPDQNNRVNAAATYGFMADLALVEIDPHTFIPKVIEYIAVHDLGRLINPQLVRGQISGGIMHGIAGALYEELDYDADGQMITGSLQDYLCPTASEAPVMIIDHHDTPSPFTELGVKGCGENSAMTAPAVIASAIDDAIGSGRYVTTLPIKPANLFQQIEGRA